MVELTVSQLIERLRSLPPDSLVVFQSGNDYADYFFVRSVSVERLLVEGDNSFAVEGRYSSDDSLTSLVVLDYS